MLLYILFHTFAMESFIWAKSQTKPQSIQVPFHVNLLLTSLKRIIQLKACALFSPQGLLSPPQATPRCLAHPRPPLLSTASRALRQCSTTLISLLTNQARWSAWLPHLPPPQVHISYSVSKYRLKSEVDLQMKSRSSVWATHIEYKNGCEEETQRTTDDEQYPVDFLFLFISFSLLLDFFLACPLLPPCTFLSSSLYSLPLCLSFVPVLHS